MKSKVIRLGLLILIGLMLSSCLGRVVGVPEAHPVSRSMLAAGRAEIINYGCGTCHTIPGIPGADGAVGPALVRLYERSNIAGHLPNTEQNLIEWIRFPQEVEPGVDMPDMGVTETSAQEIAAYLYHQPSILDWLQR